MLIGYVAVALVVLALIGVTLIFYRRNEELRERLLETAPYLRAGGANDDWIDRLMGWGRWKVIAQGGDNRSGKFRNLGFCPCESGYTVNTNQVIINAWPNPAQVAACVAGPPAVKAPEWKCKDDCINVLTHVWHGWDVVQDQNNRQLKFNCNTFGQYHCKQPTDPDAEKPPKEGHPDDPEVIEP